MKNHSTVEDWIDNIIIDFKISKGFDDDKPTYFFTMSSTGLRGHEFKLYKPWAHLDIRKNFLPSELLMNGIDCLKHYCTVVQYRLLKSNLTVI